MGQVGSTVVFGSGYVDAVADRHCDVVLEQVK